MFKGQDSEKDKRDLRDAKNFREAAATDRRGPLVGAEEPMLLSAACLPRGGWRDCASQEWAGVEYRGGANLRYETRTDTSREDFISLTLPGALARHHHGLAIGTLLALVALIQWGITTAARQL